MKIQNSQDIMHRRFIVYPGPGHLVTDPVRSKNVYDRWLNWIAEYLKKE